MPGDGFPLKEINRVTDGDGRAGGFRALRGGTGQGHGTRAQPAAFDEADHGV